MFVPKLTMKVRHETIAIIAMLTPTLVTYRSMHLAHATFDADPCRQYCVRVRFREWVTIPETVYAYGYRHQVLHDNHYDGHQLVIREGQPLYVHKYFMNGVHGKCIFWHTSGLVSERRMYCHGQLHGPYEYWAETGLISGRGQYVNGVRCGEGVVYDASGHVLRTVTYNHGMIVATD